MSALPLSGIRVLELTTAWAGPMAGRILAHMGAEVIHVESPTRTNSWRINKGDPSPVNYPDFDPGERRWDKSFLFNSQNLGKRSLAINMKDAEGLAAVSALARMSDVLICNFRPGLLARLGLDHATLSNDVPGIIVVEMPAFGLFGPHAGYAALGPTMEMAAGMSAMIAYPDGPPSVTGPSYLDPIGGFNAAAAALTALWRRIRTGQGAHIEVGQVEAAMQLIGPEILAAAVWGDSPPDGNRVSDAAPHGCYPAMGDDSWIVIAARCDQEWEALAKAMGQPHLLEDPRFRDLASRKAHEDELDALIGEWTRSQDRHRLASELQALGVPAAPVNTPADLAASEYLNRRGFFTVLDHPVAGRHSHPGLPFHLSGTPLVADRPAPGFGADNRYVLSEVLGWPEDRIAAMERDGTIADIPLKDA